MKRSSYIRFDMETYLKEAHELTIDEKLALLVGKDYWHIDSIMVSDGPHGLRKQEEDADFMGTKPSKPAVCYPTAATLGCSFDTQLMEHIGKALGEECQKEDISVLLGPGVNHKRSPLCGRNFEYFSEDPVLTGTMAAAMVMGIQSMGVGASVKHFAANSREMGRMVQDSIVDERTLREIYLKQFEIIVKKARPWTIMTAYNRLNGTYCTENSWLMEEVARKQWGFDGIFVSDWSAVSDPVKSVKNGLNVEMPGGDRGTIKRLKKALKAGEITEDEIDQRIEQLINLLKKVKEGKRKFRKQNNHEMKEEFLNRHLSLARKAAEESAVLLKNESALPLKPGEKVLLVGAFAKTPRYQGAGSSKINPVSLDNIFDAMSEIYSNFIYEEGYDLTKDDVNEERIRRACKAAEKADKVVVVAGLPDAYESEGFDRKNIFMPESHSRLIEQLAEVNANVIVVLQGGSVIDMPWEKRVNAILHMYLSGCQGGMACMNLLTGEVNPSGKLAESYPFALEDNPSFLNYNQELLTVEYSERIFTGYRYYDKASKKVRFPFGYGLSYTKFSYDNFLLSEHGNNHFTVKCEIRNIGNCAGKEIVQLYIGCIESKIMRAPKELKQFQKIELESGEKKQVEFYLTSEDFTYFNTNLHDWDVEDGEYQILIGASSMDIRLQGDVYVEGSCLTKGEDASLEKMLEPVIHQPRNPKPFTKDSAIVELNTTAFGRFFTKIVRKSLNRGGKEVKEMVDAMFFEAPIRAICTVSDTFTKDKVDGLVDLFNGRGIRGIIKLIWRKRGKENG